MLERQPVESDNLASVGYAPDRMELEIAALPESVYRRFWEKVKIDDSGCWLWQANRTTPTGYGHFWVNNEIGHKVAHRFLYEVTHGPVEAGKELHHTCHTRLCVNPDHLQPVTRKEHGALRRKATHCPQGHEYTPENTWIWHSKDGRRNDRYCQVCLRQTRKAKVEKHREYNLAYRHRHRDRLNAEARAKRAQLKTQPEAKEDK